MVDVIVLVLLGPLSFASVSWHDAFSTAPRKQDHAAIGGLVGSGWPSKNR